MTLTSFSRSSLRAGIAITALLAVFGIAAAQQGQNRRSAPQQPQRQPGAQAPGQDDQGTRRLESVTWNAVDNKLSWVVTNGERKEGQPFNPVSARTYVINMDDAIMLFNGEQRRFSRDEANSVRMLMDLISRYAVESTLWWEAGKGEAVDPNRPNLHGDKVVQIQPRELPAIVQTASAATVYRK